MKDKKYILSYGGGVNSTALLFWLVKNKNPLDEVIFADTGAEMPETINFIPGIQKFCKEKEIKFTILKANVTVKRDLPEKRVIDNLKEYCEVQRIIPFRKFRSCTDKFKIRPINKYLKLYNCNIVMYIGFDYGESSRIRQSMIDWIEYSYPLFDARITREGCKKIIKENRFQIPVKSGCYICPFQRHRDWIELREQHPELFKTAIRLEENARKRNPQALFLVHPLKDIDKAEREQTKLMIKEPCMGWCRT